MQHFHIPQARFTYDPGAARILEHASKDLPKADCILAGHDRERNGLRVPDRIRLDGQGPGVCAADEPPEPAIGKILKDRVGNTAAPASIQAHIQHQAAKLAELIQRIFDLSRESLIKKGGYEDITDL